MVPNDLDGIAGYEPWGWSKEDEDRKAVRRKERLKELYTTCLVISKLPFTSGRADRLVCAFVHKCFNHPVKRRVSTEHCMAPRRKTPWSKTTSKPRRPTRYQLSVVAAGSLEPVLSNITIDGMDVRTLEDVTRLLKQKRPDLGSDRLQFFDVDDTAFSREIYMHRPLDDYMFPANLLGNAPGGNSVSDVACWAL